MLQAFYSSIPAKLANLSEVVIYPRMLCLGCTNIQLVFNAVDKLCTVLIGSFIFL